MSNYMPILKFRRRGAVTWFDYSLPPEETQTAAFLSACTEEQRLIGNGFEVHSVKVVQVTNEFCIEDLTENRND